MVRVVVIDLTIQLRELVLLLVVFVMQLIKHMLLLVLVKEIKLVVVALLF